MPDYNVISTDQWQISLPTDWAQQPPNPENPGQFYFESSDGTKGAYLTAYARMDPETPSLDALATWRDIEIKNLHAMADHHWEILDEWRHDEAGTAISGSDCLDRSRHYRIVCLGMTQFPWLVRVSLHDYDCKDYEASKQAFLPIIDSLAPVVE